MAFLIVEQDGIRRAGTLNGRVLIGRRPTNHIVINSRLVSRIHAWIGQADERYYVNDTGSRTGTLVNGEKLLGRHILENGDQIQVGPLRVVYRTADAVPPAMAPIDLSDKPISSGVPDDGLFIDCRCGAPLWVPWDFAGRMGQCRYCGQTVVVPGTIGAPVQITPEVQQELEELAAAKAPEPEPAKPAAVTVMKPAKKAKPAPKTPVTRPKGERKGVSSASPDRSEKSLASSTPGKGGVGVVGQQVGVEAPHPSPVAEYREEGKENTATEASSAPVASIARAAAPPDSEPPAMLAVAAPRLAAPLAGRAVSDAAPPAETIEGATAAVQEAPPQHPAAPKPAPRYIAPKPSALPKRVLQKSIPAAPPARPPAGRASPAPAKPPAKAKPFQKCGVCQTNIVAGEEITRCISCGLAFHSDCWAENRGCSSYGCAQVNALVPKPPPAAGAAADENAEDSGAMAAAPVEEDSGPAAGGREEAAAAAEKQKIPIEYLMLAASVFGTLIGALTFGIPAVGVAGATFVYAARTRGLRRRGLVLLCAMLFASLGTVAGLGLSYYWWFGSR